MVSLAAHSAGAGSGDADALCAGVNAGADKAATGGPGDATGCGDSDGAGTAPTPSSSGTGGQLMTPSSLLAKAGMQATTRPSAWPDKVRAERALAAADTAASAQSWVAGALPMMATTSISWASASGLQVTAAALRLCGRTPASVRVQAGTVLGLLAAGGRQHLLRTYHARSHAQAH
eukprot:132467-Pelagomonas_calceolata.AAC.9